MLGIAADHAGYALKEEVKSFLAAKNVSLKDYGTHEPTSVDYPDYAYLLCQGIETGEIDQGLLVCGSGIGMSIAANRHPFIRAALCLTPEMATLARSHNDANVLVLGSRLISSEVAKQIVVHFLNTSFEGGRHLNRVQKLNIKQ